jgi:NAD(P)-dependent dehydrogenase (short-subunit alcohol dehydrogenase family)
VDKLDGQVVIITGSNRGIGNAIAYALAKEGANLVLAARGAESLQAASGTTASMALITRTTEDSTSGVIVAESGHSRPAAGGRLGDSREVRRPA